MCEKEKNKEMSFVITIDKTPLELSKRKKELGETYIYMRGDDSMIVNHLHETLDGLWCNETLIDLYNNSIEVCSKIGCTQHIISDYSGNVEGGGMDSITGTYHVDKRVFHLIEDTTHKLFNCVVPIIEDIERNVMYYRCNENGEVKRQTYVISNVIPFELKSGTCIYMRDDEGNTRLFKIKRKRVWRGSEVNGIKDYTCEVYGWNIEEGSKIYHKMDDTYADFGSATVPSAYILPIEVFDTFEKKYIEGMNDIQILRKELIRAVLNNHKELYGEEAYRKAECEVNSWIK